MPHKPLRSYLRLRRRAAGLSQKELAELAATSPKTISDYEREVHPISARFLIAAELIFGLSSHDLFPGLYREVEEQVSTAALALDTKLTNKDDPQAAKKRRLLAQIPSRVKPLDV